MGKLKEKDVELFLLENRDFFVNHPAILAEMDFEEEKVVYLHYFSAKLLA
jgi:uncharacterized protein YigA (DUF484 family)